VTLYVDIADIAIASVCLLVSSLGETE